MQIKGVEITEDMLKKASECKKVEDIIEIAKENGIDITVEEAEAFLDETADVELDAELLDQAAGGGCYSKKKENCETDPNPAHPKAVTDRNRTDDQESM